MLSSFDPIALAVNLLFRYQILILGLLALILYVLLAMRDIRVPIVVLTVLVWGLLIGDKAFATIGYGQVHLINVLNVLVLIGVVVNPTASRRVRAHRRVPLAALAFFVALGGANLVRSADLGMFAAKDSIMNFYAVLLIVPVALFDTRERMTRFMRRALFALLIGSFWTTVIQVAGLVGLLRDGTFVPDRLQMLTGSTITANSAAGLIILVVMTHSFRPRLVLASALLSFDVVMSLVRSVWVGAALAAAALSLVSMPGMSGGLRRYATTAAVIGAVTFFALMASGTRVGTLAADEVGSLVIFAQNPSAPDLNVSLGINVSDPEDALASSRGTAAWRFGLWKNALQTRVPENPIFGEGLGYPALRRWIDSPAPSLRRTPFHNDYLTFLVKEGLVGLIAFCVLIGSAVTRTVFAARAPLLDRDDRLFGLAMLGALMVYLGNMVFAPIIVLPYAATLFWLLVGAAFVLPPVTIAGRSRTLDSRHIEPVEATADAV